MKAKRVPIYEGQTSSVYACAMRAVNATLYEFRRARLY